jgi:hypothetical protein
MIFTKVALEYTMQTFTSLSFKIQIAKTFEL